MSSRSIVSGVDQLLKKLNALNDAVDDKQLGRALFSASKPMMDKAKELAPKDSGNLAKQIRRRRVKTDGRVSGVEVYLGKKGYYGRFIELGMQAHHLALPGKSLKINGQVVRGPIIHPGLSAKPFFRPAYDATIDEVRRRFAENIKKELTK